MNSPPQTTDAPHAADTAAVKPTPPATPKKFHALLAASLCVACLALAWRLFGFRIEVARAAMLLVAALALAGLFRLSERAAGREVAWATVLCTALYPVFFAQISTAQLDTAAAALTFWGLVLYLPPKRAETGGGVAVEGVVGEGMSGEGVSDKSVADKSVAVGSVEDENVAGEGVDEFDGAPSLRRRAACVAVFALAALAKETAVLAAVALASWEVVCRLVGRFGRGAARALCVESGRPLRHTFLWLLAPLPLAAWLVYHESRTGYFFGRPEYFRYNMASTVGAARVAETLWACVWRVTAHMNLWALTVPTVVAMFLPALKDGGVERRRIDVRVQLVFAAVVVLYVASHSMIGPASSARDMLPAVPLVILVCVSTLRRRVRRWRLLVAAACAAFVAGLFGK